MIEKINNIFRFDYGIKKDLIPVMIAYAISAIVSIYGVRIGVSDVKLTEMSLLFSTNQTQEILVIFFCLFYVGITIFWPATIGISILEFYYKSFISENINCSILPISKKKAMENIFLQIGISLLIYLVILGSSIYNMAMILELLEISEVGILHVLYTSLRNLLISMIIATIGINLDIFISKYKVHKYSRLTIDGVVTAVILSVMLRMVGLSFGEINIIVLAILLLVTLVSGFLVLKNIDNMKIN